MTTRIDEKLHARVMQRVRETVEKINNHYKIDLQVPPVSYDLTGTSAGIARYATMSVHLQPKLFLENIEEFIDNVVPHEVCHLGVMQKYIKERKINPPKAHGAEWKLMMYVVGAAAKRTHDYDVEEIVKPAAQYHYDCGCPNGLTVSRSLHNKLKTARYKCKKCDKILHNGERILKHSFSRPSPNGTTKYEEELETE